jgi:hypothetical protein
LLVLTLPFHLLQGAEYHPLRMSCRMAAPSTAAAASQFLLLTSAYQVIARGVQG